MKKNFLVTELRLSDWPVSLQPFWQNVKAVNDPFIRYKTILIAIVCYAVLSPRLRVMYYYNYVVSMILLNLLCIGPSGKGKSIVRFIVNMLIHLLFDIDDKERDIENEWKRRNKGKTKKEEEPLVCYRIFQKFTLPQAVKLEDNIRHRFGDILPFFLTADELGSFIENKRGNTEFASVGRTAYNLGEIYSRDTLYADGHNARVDICWNSVVCGQEFALSKYITKEGLLLGDASRQIIIKLGEGIGDEAPRMLPFTAEQEQCINDTINRLMAETFTPDGQLQPTHEVDMSWLDKDVKGWCDWQREIIDKSPSRAHDSFYGRASESAFRIATIVYHLFGEDPTKQKNVRRIYFFFAKYILDGIMAQWGKAYEAAMPKEIEATLARPTLYDSISKRFTRSQLTETINNLGLNTAARKVIYKWKQRKWIYEVDDAPDTYEKIY